MMSNSGSNLQKFWDTVLLDPHVEYLLRFRGYFYLSTKRKKGSFCIADFAAQAQVKNEARLLTKFDHQDDLPLSLRRKNLSVISISNTDYIVSEVNPFFELNTKVLIPKYIDPKFNRLINPLDFSTEKDGITVAYNSGIFRDFLGADVELSISGRFGYDRNKIDSLHGQYFSRDHSRVPLQMGNTQIEVDASFENDNFISIVEANDAGRVSPKTFNLRQLYYPLKEFRLRDNMLGNVKSRPIRPIYMNTHNHFLTLFELRSVNESQLESFELVKQVDYKFKDPNFEQKINSAYNTTSQLIPVDLDGDEIIFPQADKVIDLLLPQLSEFSNPKGTQDIAQLIGYVGRQGSYYGNALAYIGLVNRKRNGSKYYYTLSSLGTDYIGNRDDFAVARHLLTLPVFREMIKHILIYHKLPSLEVIQHEMINQNVVNSKSNVLVRRSQTVKAILAWVFNQIF